MIKNEITKIAVLGCGWLGLPLAISLRAKGFFINGSTTVTEKLEILARHQIAPFLVQLNPKIEGDDIQSFLQTDLLIVNVPPGRSTSDADDYAERMENLVLEVSKSTVKNIIFISSTSVYPEINATVSENLSVLSNSASALRMLAAENIIKSLEKVKCTIIRMAGLIGPNRHPGRFFAGKQNIPNGKAPVNLIHLDDCIGIIEHVIQHHLWDNTFNAASPLHPAKMDFYDLASQKLSRQNASFIDDQGVFKIVNSDKIIASGYHFKHPDLMKWLQQSHQN